MNKYNFKKIEQYWIKYWENFKLYRAPEKVRKGKKMYVLPQLPYPSGSGLHTGHSSVYIPCDIYARYKRMVGNDVLQVIGWDAFGLPAENFAIKTNIHPKINTDNAIENFRLQIKSMGLALDYDREVGSHNPDYYKWTQWFFLLMYKQGLAYRAKQIVNWCDSCKTVLANEQVIEEKCERCGTEIIHKEMEQWYLKITDYADRLAKDLDKVDWPKSTIERQRNWIGKKEGINISYNIKDSNEIVTVFTTRPDTNFGATFIVIAPEHPLVDKITKSGYKAKVKKYISEAQSKSELERTELQKDKTGQFTGSYAINQLTGYEMPIYIADYVLMNFGTGAVVGVPGHDLRDFDFAKKYNIEVIRVVVGKDGDSSEITKSEQVQEEEGKMINSGFLDGMDIHKATSKIIHFIEDKGWGKRQVNYKLHDWSVSRQRFWGAPIPMLLKRLPSDKYNVLVLHGTGADSSKNWFPWLKEEMEKNQIEIAIPNLPKSLNPNYPERMKFIENKYKNYVSESSVVIGHSSGALTAMHIATIYKIRKMILVSPIMFVDKEYEKKLEESFEPQTVKDLIDYANQGIDHKNINKNVDEISILFGKDDPYLPVKAFAKFAREHYPDAVIKIIPNKGHLNAEDGTTEFPELVDFLPTSNVVMKPVPESDLPVLLPDDVDFKPTGQSPLTYSKEFQAGVEDKYGKGWKREVDTLDTFMCSSWYYFRYIDPHNDKEFASQKALKEWMPVDFYIGGPEHVNGHLLYSRFFTKVLFDAEYINFDEPFLFHRHQGMVLGEDNRKMSKRWGNVINPSEVMAEYGADTLRMYQMFMGPLEQTKTWSTNGIRGVHKFINRIWDLFHTETKGDGKLDLSILDKTIKKVGEDIENLSFNTAVAQMMEFANWYKKNISNISSTQRSDIWDIFLRVMAPFAPYITEELWKELGHKSSIHLSKFPKFDLSKTKMNRIIIAVQVNGKLRSTFETQAGITEQDAIAIASQLDIIKKYIAEGTTKKTIYIKDRLVNFVIG